MKDRSRVVLVQGTKVALIRREREGMTYYVFPGGGIEAGETPEQAAIRESQEELGLHIRPDRLVAIDHLGGVRSFFYLAEVVDGVFGTGRDLPNPDRGTYVPVWIELSELAGLDVRPKDVARAVASGLLVALAEPLITGT